MILNGLLNTLDESEVMGDCAETTLKIVKSTIEGDFDNNVRKTAIGLIQDLTGNLQHKYDIYIDQTVKLLTQTLKNDSYPPEVKMFTICAIGDLILVAEEKFKPYFGDTMELLIQAGQMSVTLDQDLPQSELKTFNEIRHALVDCFLSTINGMKCADDQYQQRDADLEPHYLNMFYYLEALIS